MVEYLDGEALNQEQCKKCFHYQVCANVMKRQLFLRKAMLKEENPQCKHFKSNADFQEVKHGELNHIVDFGNGICVGYCSYCGTEHRAKNPSLLKYSYKYCRWCGAKLDGGKSE